MLVKSIWVLLKGLWKDDTRDLLVQDGMERWLKDRGMGWLFQPEHAYLDYNSIIYREEVMGKVHLDGDVHMWDFGLITGDTAKFIIETLKKSPDSIWRK